MFLAGAKRALRSTRDATRAWWSAARGKRSSHKLASASTGPRPTAGAATQDDAPKAEQRILIVDDDATVRRLLHAILRSSHQLSEAATGEEALEQAARFAPDMILLDIMMPGMDGYEICRRVKEKDPETLVIMVSALSSPDEQMRAIEVGADDYIVKPFDPPDLRARLRLHFRLRSAVANVHDIRGEIESRNSQLRFMMEQHQRDVVAIQDTAVFTLAKVAESRDQETGGHLARMRAYSYILGEELGREGPYTHVITRQFLDDLYRSSPLHDIGKVGIRDEILLKPGPLTEDEFAVMQQHTIIGANILDEAVSHTRGGGFLSMGALIARFHHEQFDGSGYPAGLVGPEIPLPARIVAVADVFDALTSERPYKSAYTVERARAIILDGAGKHFDPIIVEAFRRRFNDILREKQNAMGDFPITYGALSFREYDETGSFQWPVAACTLR